MTATKNMATLVATGEATPTESSQKLLTKRQLMHICAEAYEPLVTQGLKPLRALATNQRPFPIVVL